MDDCKSGKQSLVCYSDLRVPGCHEIGAAGRDTCHEYWQPHSLWCSSQLSLTASILPQGRMGNEGKERWRARSLRQSLGVHPAFRGLDSDGFRFSCSASANDFYRNPFYNSFVKRKGNVLCRVNEVNLKKNNDLSLLPDLYLLYKPCSCHGTWDEFKRKIWDGKLWGKS